jgi:hypothetical protein
MIESPDFGSTYADQLRISVFEELDSMTPHERGGRTPHAVADWLLDSAFQGLSRTRAVLGENAEPLEPYLTVIAVFQEVARRMWYIGRVHSGDRSLEWETRLLWDFTSAMVRDLYETTGSALALTAQGFDAPTKVLLRHAMELYARQLVVLRDPKEQRAYLTELQRLRDFQNAGRDETGSAPDYRSVGLSGGALMDRVALIEQNLDESSLPSREQAASTAALLRDLYVYFSNLTHGGPEIVDDVLYVYDPSFPSGQKRRAWSFGKPTRDGDLALEYLTMLLWQFWRYAPRALERSGLADTAVGDVGVLLVAARALDRAVVRSFGKRVFSAVRAGEVPLL